ncbi:hypothetical protein [Rhodococcus koreensis]|uniref:Uncharacterized protein n=1 Tax=Rhodococcus koreensis TaxID=99653 RepID=A0A1H4I524_9NOCA|nr:hypothetical protein [Rhodococcus koreensis]SEB29021.1 hypothetical protein SAMN04490239_0001 [Rhodococcus koreensis]
MNDMNLPVPEQDPTASPATPKRWRWITAVVVAVVVGAALGTAVAKATERDVLAERTAALEQREAEVAQRDTDTAQKEDSLSLRSDGLDTRQAELDKISADLGRREQALLPKEQAAARSKITKDGIYLVGKDIEPGTYQTSAGAGATGNAPVAHPATSTTFSRTETKAVRRSSRSRPPTSRSPQTLRQLAADELTRIDPSIFVGPFCHSVRLTCEHGLSGREDPSTLELQE